MKVHSLLLLLALTASCRAASTSPYRSTTETERNTVLAQSLSREAADLLYTDAERAEELLRRALAADTFYGPAHNNLGVLHLERGELYEAANEFEWARKLMPGHPDPRMNLALTLERAGRTDEAIRTYEAALSVYPGHLPSTQALARLRVESNPHEEKVVPLLRAVVLQGETQAWRDWARRHLERRTPQPVR